MITLPRTTLPSEVAPPPLPAKMTPPWFESMTLPSTSVPSAFGYMWTAQPPGLSTSRLRRITAPRLCVR